MARYPEMVIRHGEAVWWRDASEEDKIIRRLLENTLATGSPTPYEAMRMASYVYGFRLDENGVFENI